MASFLKDLASVSLSKGGVIFFGLIKAIIIARWLGPETNGLIAALTVYPSLFMTIGSLGIRQATAYHVGKDIYSLNYIKKALCQIWLISSVVSLISCFFLISYFSNSGDNLILILLAISPIPFTLFITYNSGIFLGKNKIAEFNKINWIPPFVILLFTFLLVVIFKGGINGAMISAIGGPFVMSLILLFKNDFVRAFSLEIDWKIIKSLLSLGLTYAFALLIINLNYKVDILLLDKLSNPFELGIYSKGSQLMEYLWQIPMLLSTIVFARSATAKNGSEFSFKVIQLLRISIVIVGCGAIVLFFFSKFIIVLLFGSEFEASSTIQQVLLPGVLLLTIFKVLNMDLAGKGKPWVSMKAMIPALIINTILNVLWIPEYGSIGAATSSTISYSIAAILFLYFYSKETKIPIYLILKYSKSDIDWLKPILLKLKNR